MSASWNDEYLTVKEIAEHLKLNQQTLRNWIDRASSRRFGLAGASASCALISIASSRRGRPRPPSRNPHRPDRLEAVCRALDEWEPPEL